MRKLKGSGLVIAGALLLVMGVVLRWDLIDWLIDAAGLVLVVMGAVLGVIGLVQMFTGGGGRDYDDF